MKIVGLKIEKGLVAATVLEKGFRQSELVESFSRSFSTDAELIEILKEKARDWANARIVSSIPGHFFSQRSVMLPFSDRARVEKALPFEIEDTVPFDINDMVLDHVVLEGAKNTEGKREVPVLGILLPKTILRQHLELLASAGLDPQAIVPSFIGLHAISKRMKIEGNGILLCENDICVKSGETIQGLRSFSDAQSTMGLRHTLRSFETDNHAKIEKATLLCPSPDAQAALVDMGIAVEEQVSEFNGKKAADPVSLGLALTEEINFRRGEFSFRLVDEGERRQKRTLLIAALVVALLVVINLGVKFYVVQTNYGKLESEMKQIYLQTFPAAKSVADPMKQMRSKIDETRKKYTMLGLSSSALDVMKAVTDNVPKEVRVNFNEFSLDGEKLRLSGEAGSFEAIDKIKGELQKAPLFSEVLVQDTRMGVENKVKFRVDIKLKQGI